MYSKILTPAFQAERTSPEQVKNKAGGYVYRADDWECLDRFLILGSAENTYYFGKRELSQINVDLLRGLIAKDGSRVVAQIVEISHEGRCVKNDPCVFALALCVKLGDTETKRMALGALPRVCRIGTHLFQFLAECDSLKVGWGRAFKRAVAGWYLGRDPGQVAYQAVKYRSRFEWTHRDALRLSHAKPGEGHGAILGAIAGKSNGHAMYAGFLEAQKTSSVKDLVRLIGEYRLPWEAVPTPMLAHAEVWDALLPNLPYTATLRNLGKMTSIGLLKPASAAALQIKEKLSKADARVHPLSILIAMRTYASGHGMKGSLEWKPVPTICQALDHAFVASFKKIPKISARTLIAIDTSGSMRGPSVAGLSLHEAAGCMALAMLAANSESKVIGIDTSIHEMDLLGRRLDDVAQEIAETGGGGTELGLAYADRSFDLYVTYTDTETWHGNRCEEVWGECKPTARAVVASMVASHETPIPSSGRVLNLVGFDPTLPSVISAFAGFESGSEEE